MYPSLTLSFFQNINTRSVRSAQSVSLLRGSWSPLEPRFLFTFDKAAATQVYTPRIVRIVHKPNLQKHHLSLLPESDRSHHTPREHHLSHEKKNHEIGIVYRVKSSFRGKLYYTRPCAIFTHWLTSRYTEAAREKYMCDWKITNWTKVQCCSCIGKSASVLNLESFWARLEKEESKVSLII